LANGGYGQQDRDDLLWDIPRLNRLSFTGRASFPLATTGVNGGVWQFGGGGGTTLLYTFSLRITSDTTINWTLSYKSAPTALTARRTLIMRGNVNGFGNTFTADVAAAPAGMTTIDSGLVPANSRVEVLAPAWYSHANANDSLIVTTNAVVANVTVCYDFLSLND